MCKKSRSHSTPPKSKFPLPRDYSSRAIVPRPSDPFKDRPDYGYGYPERQPSHGPQVLKAHPMHMPSFLVRDPAQHGNTVRIRRSASNLLIHGIHPSGREDRFSTTVSDFLDSKYYPFLNLERGSKVSSCGSHPRPVHGTEYCRSGRQASAI